METNGIEVRRTLTLSTIGTGITSYSTPIFIEFIPDEVICKAIYFSSATAGNAILVQSTISRDFLIPTQDTIDSLRQLDLHFKVTQPIAGNYTFNFLTFKGVTIDPRGVTNFSLALEFVKYKSVQPQKIY